MVLCPILFFVICISPFKTFATPPDTVRKNLVIDFGGNGNGIFNNTEAFIRAGIYFSNFVDKTGNGDTIGELIIPSSFVAPAAAPVPAIYKVGKQLLFKDSFSVTCAQGGISVSRTFSHSSYNGGVVQGINGMMLLKGINGLIIRSSNPDTIPTIKYIDSLRFGSFLKPYYTFRLYGSVCNSITCLPYSAGVTSDTNFSNKPAWGCNKATCDSCTCETSTPGKTDTFTGPPIIIDTQYNNSNQIVPLNWYGENKDYRTKAYIGQFMWIENCNNVEIKNINIDGNNASFIWGGTYGDAGIQIPHSGIYLGRICTNIRLKNLDLNQFGEDGLCLYDTANNGIYLEDCNFNKNTRNGFSYTAGENVTAINCEFNYTGVNNDPRLSNPGAGVDIESDGKLYNLNGDFTNCKFIKNKGYGLVNDANAHLSRNMIFNNCTFHDLTDFAIGIKGKNFHFIGCKIYGSFLWGNMGDTLSLSTRFFNCDFEDKPYFNGGTLEYITHKQPLIQSDKFARNLSFDSCRFTVNDTNRSFMFYVMRDNTAEADFMKIKNCIFENLSVYDTTHTSRMAGVIFEGNNTIKTTQDTAIRHRFEMSSVIIKGSTDLCDPDTFNLEGYASMEIDNRAWNVNDLGRTEDTNTDGHLIFNIGDRSRLCAYKFNGGGAYTELEIGKYTILHNKSGGSLQLDLTNLWIEGKLICDEGSKSKFRANIKGLAGSTDEFYMHKTQKDSTYWLKDTSSGIFFTPFSIDSTKIKIDGGMTSLSGNYPSAAYEALYFDSTDYVSIPVTTTTEKLATYADTCGEDFTIEISFKKENKNCIIFSHGSLFEIGISTSDKLFVRFPVYVGGVCSTTNNASPYTYITTTTLSDNVCYAMALRRQSGVLKVFLDGKEIYHIGSNSSIASLLPNSPASVSNILLGKKATGFNFKGWIGQVRIWTRSLPVCELAYNYVRKAPFDANGLVADWDMTCATTGCTTITDISGVSPAVSGTVHSTTWVSQNTIGGACENPYQNFKSENLNQDQFGENLNSAAEILLYPNPNNGNFTVELQGIQSEYVNTSVYDINGRLIYKENSIIDGSSAKQVINLGPLSKGVYFIKISAKDLIKNRTFLIE